MTISQSEAYVRHLRRYVDGYRRDSLADVRILAAWVSDPLDVTQIVYCDLGTGVVRGLMRREPVDDPTELVPEPPEVVHDPDTDLDPVNRELADAAYQRVWDLIEPHDPSADVRHQGILWFGDGLTARDYDLLPDECRVDLH